MTAEIGPKVRPNDQAPTAYTSAGTRKTSGDGSPIPALIDVLLVDNLGNDARTDRLAAFPDGKAVTHIEGYGLVQVHEHDGVIAR